MNKTKETALNLMVEGNLTMAEIASCVKKTRQTLYNWLENDAEFKEEYERRQADMSRMARARISQLTSKAIARADKILVSSKNDIAAASVIKDVLDRAGCNPEKSQVEADLDLNIKIDYGDKDAGHNG